MENPEPQSFLDQVRLGQTDWFRYFFGLILIVFLVCVRLRVCDCAHGLGHDG